jgi:hypothetical protein
MEFFCHLGERETFPLSNGSIDPNRRGNMFIFHNIATPTSKSWSNVNKKGVGCP